MKPFILRQLTRAVVACIATAPIPALASAAVPARPGDFALGITFSPYGGTYYAAPITVRIGWCDTVNGTRKVKWNNSQLAGSFPRTMGSDPACSGTFRYSDVSLTMQAGTSTTIRSTSMIRQD